MSLSLFIFYLEYPVYKQVKLSVDKAFLSIRGRAYTESFFALVYLSMFNNSFINS